MKTKTETPELIAALCKAQAKFSPAIKDAANPFFKSKYADLNAVWDACKQGISENELFVSQQTYTPEENKTMLRTRVYHSSGGYIESEIQVVVAKQNDPQSFGSALTYFRRYSLAAILGIVVDDDDAEAGMSRNDPKQQQKAPQHAVRQAAPVHSQQDAIPMSDQQKTTITELLASTKIPAEMKEKAEAWLNNGKPKTLQSASEMIQKLAAAKSMKGEPTNAS